MWVKTSTSLFQWRWGYIMMTWLCPPTVCSFGPIVYCRFHTSSTPASERDGQLSADLDTSSYPVDHAWCSCEAIPRYHRWRLRLCSTDAIGDKRPYLQTTERQFCCQLHLLIPCPTQHLIGVATRAVPGGNPRGQPAGSYKTSHDGES